MEKIIKFKISLIVLFVGMIALLLVLQKINSNPNLNPNITTLNVKSESVISTSEHKENSVIESPCITSIVGISKISKAAIRNNCVGKDYILLLAIRKAENGNAGREFGVLHSKAVDTNLDTQAGWAAATIIANKMRFIESLEVLPASGGVEPTKADASGIDYYQFINFLADKYCPKKVDPVGNKNWKRNVPYWFDKFSSSQTGK